MISPQPHPAILPSCAPEPLARVAADGVEPEGATALARWGRFDGSCMDFGPTLADGQTARVAACDGAEAFPRALGPGASVRLALPALDARAAPLHLRVRGAFLESDAGLMAAVGGTVLLNERFVYTYACAPGNFSGDLSGMAVEFTRIVFVPPDALRGVGELVLSNPGTRPVWFDAVQLERQVRPGRGRCLGLGAGQHERNHYDSALARTWGGIRTSLRTQRIGPPDDPDRFARVDKLFSMIVAKNPVVQPILEGTPPWAAISTERLAQAEAAHRPSTVPPDPAKYAELVEAVVRRYGASIDTYEVWNEADIGQFYRGTTAEYVALFHAVAAVVRRLAPASRLMTTGMAGCHEEFLRELDEGGVLRKADLFAFHPYAGKSAAWEMPYGIIEGCLFSRGCGIEVFCNESGFPHLNAEWFQAPPVFTEATQRDSLDTAMARLLAMGVAKLSVFHAGGDNHAYGLIDETGRPRPAYAVFADYARLNSPGATRLDIGMVHADGSALRGVYAAASAHTDGRVTVVLNPADCAAPQGLGSAALIPVRLRLPLRSDIVAATASVRQGAAQEARVATTVHREGGVAWADVALPLSARCALELVPDRQAPSEGNP
jgi:hypothetical protein